MVTAELLYQKGVGRQATYIFKHALIQDTAYETLLRSRRQQLHQQVVTVLEQQFPELVETQPELLAHHLTEAGLKQEALLMWEKAGNKAMEQNTDATAIHHLQKAISLLPFIEVDTTRLKKELQILAVYHRALMAIKGWGHPEIKQVSDRIFQLSDQLNDDTQKFQYFMGYASMYAVQGQAYKWLAFNKKIIAFTQGIKDKDYLPIAYIAETDAYFQLGNFEASKKNATKILKAYDESKHNFLSYLGAGNVKVYASIYVCWNLLLTGFSEQANNAAVKAFKFATQQKDIISNYRGYVGFGRNLMLQKEWRKAADLLQPFIHIVEESGEWIILMGRSCDLARLNSQGI